MTTVSIVVPCFNVEDYLSRCVDSLVNQTLENIEIILINDASPDNGIEIMKEYELKYPNKIRVVDSPVNLKQGGARNLGIEFASGEFIGFVDGDDWVGLSMYEVLYTKAKETNCDIVGCDIYVSDGNKVTNCLITHQGCDFGKLNEYKRKKLIISEGSICSKIYKRELFTDNNINFPEHLFYEDNPIVPLLLAYSNHFEKVSKPLYYYYMRESSTVRIRNSYHHFDRLKTSKILVDEFKSRGFYARYRNEIDFRFIELFYLNTISTCLTCFDDPEITILKNIREYMKKNMKKYRKNKYFKNLSRSKKIVSKLNDINPKLLTWVFRLKKLI